MKFKAPPHVTDVRLSTGPLRVDTKGEITIDESTVLASDLQHIAAAGFAPVDTAKPTAGSAKAD